MFTLAWRILGKLPPNFSAHFFRESFVRIFPVNFLQSFQAPPKNSPPKIHAQICRHSSHISLFGPRTFSCWFLLAGESNVCLSWYFHDLSRYFPDFVLFLFLWPLRAPTRNIPEMIRDIIRTFPEKVGNAPVWETPRFTICQDVKPQAHCEMTIYIALLKMVVTFPLQHEKPGRTMEDGFTGCCPRLLRFRSLKRIQSEDLGEDPLQTRAKMTIQRWPTWHYRTGAWSFIVWSAYYESSSTIIQ